VQILYEESMINSSRLDCCKSYKLFNYTVSKNNPYKSLNKKSPKIFYKKREIIRLLVLTLSFFFSLVSNPL